MAKSNAVFRRPLSIGFRTAVLVCMAVLAAQPAANCEPADSDAYRVGPEDIVTLTVVRHPEFSGEFLIPADGAVHLPYVGRSVVTGKTLTEIADLVAGKLRERLRDPEVTAALKTARMQRVYVLGAVEKPGLYDMKPGWRVTEALAAASGLTKGIEPADCSVTVLRASTGTRSSLKLTDVLQGQHETNVAIQSGDVVNIDAQETLPIYVIGRVKIPGLYRVRKDNAGVMEGLTLAGGVLEDAALTKVTVTHLAGPPETIDLTSAMVSGKQQAQIQLRPGDLVIVPEETARIAVLGYVNKPGFYPLRSGHPITLSDAIGLANGTDNKRGELGSVAIVRTASGKQERLIFDLRKFLKSGDATQNPEVLSGDVVYVPQTSKPDWSSVFQAIGSIGAFMAPFVW